MKLLEIKVKNFRALCGEGITISLEGSNIIFLLGQNNVGKSAVLSAYEYLVTPKKKSIKTDFYDFSPLNVIEMEAIFLKEHGDSEDFEKKGMTQWIDAENKIRFRKRWTAADEEGKKETWDPATNAFIENGFGGLESFLKYFAPTPIRIPAVPSTQDLTKWTKDVLKAAVLKQLHETEKEQVERIVADIASLQQKVISHTTLSDLAGKANLNFQKVFPGLALLISPSEGASFDLGKSLESEFDVVITDEMLPDRSQGFESHGTGVIRQAMFNFLGLVKEGMKEDINFESTDKKCIILFEEPEIYLHPKAVKMLREVLYNLGIDSPFQILCASHSPTLIDISQPHTSIVRVTKKSDNTRVAHQAGDGLFSTDADQKDRVQMANRFDPNVCEVFFCDDVILVEGDTEAIVCRELLNGHFKSKDIYVLNTGSKNNMPFFQRILTHFKIKHHIIHDSDTRFRYQIKNGDGGRTYEPARNKDNSQAGNSAWSLNTKIWQLIEEANSIEAGMACRYVSVYNFEDNNKYVYDSSKGKPLSAFEFASKHLDIKSTSIYHFISCIAGENISEMKFNDSELEILVEEPNSGTINATALAIDAIKADFNINDAHLTAEDLPTILPN